MAADRVLACPVCGEGRSVPFYGVPRCVVRETASFTDPDLARAGPFGAIDMRFCEACGFAWNAAFDERLAVFDESFETTQTASPAFVRFQDELARDLDERCGGLRGKHVVELGCGQGEFLNQLCPLAGARGTGFDPILRAGTTAATGVHLTKALYGPDTAPRDTDLLVHKLTLEHVPDVAVHLAMLHASLHHRPGTRLFVMVPDFAQILADRAFYTVHYEHCSYFSPGTLARALRRAGFGVDAVWRSFGQFLCALATVDPRPGTALDLEEPVAATAEQVRGFAADVEADRAGWRGRFARWAAGGQRVVLWGAASRTVAFVQAIGEGVAIDRIVDVNPAKRGNVLPGSGHPIVHPDDLPSRPPDVAVVMSPVYTEEIRGMLAQRGLAPVLVRVDDRPSLSRRS